MRALILAAGRGERMRPLTDTTPKPMLRVGGKALLEWHIENLRQGGINDIVINHAHLGEVIESGLGDGSRYGVRLRYSREGEALETAGGIAFALPLLEDEVFAVVNGDVYTDYDMGKFIERAREVRARHDCLAHLVLVDNPVHHPEGDFALAGDKIERHGSPMLTYSGVGVYRRAMFKDIVRGEKAKLAPLLYAAIERGALCGEYYDGIWDDVGTPVRLANVDRAVSERQLGRQCG